MISGLILLIFAVYIFIGVIVGFALDEDPTAIPIFFWPIVLVGMIVIGIFTVAMKIGQWIHRFIGGD